MRTSNTTAKNTNANDIKGSHFAEIFACPFNHPATTADNFNAAARPLSVPFDTL